MEFNIVDIPVQASVNRIVALWYADVDRLTINNQSDFTGAAAMFSIYTLSGCLQYYISFFDMNGNIFQTWLCAPENVKLSEASKTENSILDFLKKQNVIMMPVLQATATYKVILKKLPLLMLLEDKTPYVGEFNLETLNNPNGLSLSSADRTTLKSVVTLF